MRIYFVIAVAFALFVNSPASADDDLQTDLSRGQLFARFILPNEPGGGQVLSLDRDFVFPDDVVKLSSTGKPLIVGIDISHHNTDGCNCEINWTAMYDAGVRFVYAKASQGHGSDPRMQSYMKGLNALPLEKKLHKGTFHFMSADGSGEDQGLFYVQNLDSKLAGIGAKREPDDLPPVVDAEWDYRVDKHGKPVPCSDGKVHKDCWETVAPDEIVTRLSAWLNRVRELTGKNPIIYTAKSWIDQRIKDEDKFAKLGSTVWIADYVAHDKSGKRTILTVNPRVPEKTQDPLWQFSDRAAGPDNSNLDGIDADIFKGSIDEFKTTFQISK